VLVHSLVAEGFTSVEALGRAYHAVDETVVRQTMLLTYMEAFRIVGIFFMCCIPLLLLFRRPRHVAVVAAPH
jgi:DHA2 family multidrug resistance protein